MNTNAKLVKKLETLEKRAATMTATAKTYTEIGRANALRATVRIMRGALQAQGVITE